MDVMKLDETNLKKIDGGIWEYQDFLSFDGSVEIAANLGYVRFGAGINVKGYLYAEAGTGIEAGWGIKAGEGIEAGEGIVTFYYGGITARWITALRVIVGLHVRETQLISAELREGTPVLLGIVKGT